MPFRSGVLSRGVVVGMHGVVEHCRVVSDND